MVEFGVIATADDGEFIGDVREVLENIRHFEAGVAALPKRPLARQHLRRARLGEFEIQIAKLAGNVCPAYFTSKGLDQRCPPAGSAMHESEMTARAAAHDA